MVCDRCIMVVRQQLDHLNMQEKLHKDYHILSTLFSSVEGVTIEKYVILQRIEKVKELLMYDEINRSEISYTLGHSKTYTRQAFAGSIFYNR